jgi:sensor c-di-GMP phosphodiesterase-like protein
MGTVVRGFSRRNLIAIGASVLFAAACLFTFDFWLSGLIERQGQEEAHTSARRAVALAEARVLQVIESLDGLAARGVASCTPDNVQAMREAAFGAAPLKEIAVVTSSGNTLCTHLALPLGNRVLVSSELLTGADGYSLDILDLDTARRMVRLRRKVGEGPNGIAALVTSALFLPQVSSRGNVFDAYAHIATREGAIIGIHGTQPIGERVFIGTAISERFAFSAQVVIPAAPVVAEYAYLRWMGISVAGGIVVVLAALLMLLRRRSRDNPVAELERALRAGEFVPYYQPVVDIHSGKLRGAEVLVRWRKPDGSMVLPGSFIPLAESSGLIRAMTRDLMRRVCKEAGAALSHRPSLKVSFNFAGKLFSDESIVKEVRNIFAASPIKFSQVVLEVTERDPIENFTETRRTIAALQGLGVRIAIDDVGTGHSGLSYMLKLGVDIIKIDKMFVDAIGTDRNSRTIVETLVDLAHNMRMDVVAEGVEDFEQVMHLRELGVRSAQGYVFAPPLPGSAFLQLIEAIDPLPAAAPAPAQAPAIAAA